MERKTISVAGMSCNGCEQNVESALQKLNGVTRVKGDHKADTVEVVVDNDVVDDDIHAAIEQAGYDVTAWSLEIGAKQAFTTVEPYLRSDVGTVRL